MPTDLKHFAIIAVCCGGLVGCASLLDPLQRQTPEIVEPDPTDAGSQTTPTQTPVAPRLKPPPPAAEPEDAAPGPVSQTRRGPVGFPPTELMGANRGTVRNRIGAATIVRTEPPAITWIYRSDLCDFSISFYPTVDGEEYRALQYKAGYVSVESNKPIEEREIECIRSLLSP